MIVVVGFGSAGYSAVMTIRQINRKCKIVVIDPKESDLIHPCGLPYSLEGVVNEEELIQDIGLSRMNVDKIRGSVKSIDKSKKTIIIETGDGEQEVQFEKLLLTTGSKPVIPPIKNIESFIDKDIFTLSSVMDLKKIKSSLNNKKSAIVIGAGAIGLETAFALKKHVDSVTIIEGMNQPLPGVLDSDMAATLQEHIEESKIGFIKGEFVKEIKGDVSFEGVVTTTGKIIEGDILIVAAGFKANTTVAENSGFEIDRNGIRVNRFLGITDDIYGAGDCISIWSVIDNKPIGAKLATSAYKQGVVAGKNIAGIKTEYLGSTITFVSKIGELEIAGTGYNLEGAKDADYSGASGKIKTGILPDYFPENDDIAIKIIFDKDSGKILGGQAVGRKGAAERINLISMAIEFNVNMEDFSRIEMAYCPAVSEVYDPLLRAVDFGLRRVKR